MVEDPAAQVDVPPEDEDAAGALPVVTTTTHTVLLDRSHKGTRLDRVLAQALPSLSRARIQGLMEDGHVLLDGVVARASHKVRGGETCVVVEPIPTAVSLVPQDLPLDILWQDSHVLLLNKAAGMVVHPALGNPDGTLVNAILFHIQDLKGISGEVRPGIVHRLDRDTSGVMVVAKSDQALQHLQAQFKARTTHKRYLALVRGVPKTARGTFNTPFGRHPVHRQRFTGRTGDRNAVTDYLVLGTFDGVTALELTLHTGRTHQIRVHLSEAGWPILGDDLYAGHATAALAPRQMLHATLLELQHPVTNAVLRTVAPPPPDLEGLARQLGLWTAVETWLTALRRNTSAHPPGSPNPR